MPTEPAPAPRLVAPTFLALYGAAFLRPRAAMAALLAHPQRLRLGALSVALTAALYTLVYVGLSEGGAWPSSFTPWLALPRATYYRYNVFLAAPSILLCWIAASGVVQLLARALGGDGAYEDTAATIGLSLSIASWTTGVHDLAAATLGGLHLVDLAEHERAMNAPTFWRALIWTLMVLYVIAFPTLYTLAARATHRLSLPSALACGMAGFAVYQSVFFVFNR